ncbi:PREDICTED: putative E3 ubiquitin-protein ligase RF298 [Tarenaya hassleriana]|uniref:putative E3 ubiquitin-protein ligase RF298 n=1 Tax=Tarenaya hassleriana TaxID=28532 RepID=UPI0008FD464F|nr:PREDICTED: putative E3 ubiquitin-protein ligase RF298 [Tarenaya hassleriana]
MVQKGEEMNDSGVNGGKVGTFSVSHQEKGRKNKRKLADPSQQNAANLPSSLTEFPRYELPSPKLTHTPSTDLRLLETLSGQPKVEESQSIGWDDPLACQLEELLLSNLTTLFCSAIKQIVDDGYREDVVLKAISSSGLYCGGNDLVSNLVNDTVGFLKSGKEGAGSRDTVFEDLQQLVAYTLVEMTGLVREVRPSLSTVEAMWRLLMCDLNVLQACEVEGDGLEGGSSGLGTEINPPKSSDPDNRKLSPSNAQNNQTEPLKFGNFPNLPNSKNPHARGTKPGKEVFSGGSASGEGIKTTSLASVFDEKLLPGRKGRTKKEIAMLRQKSCVEKIRTYSKGSDYKAAKFASVGGFLVEKRVKSPSDLAALQERNFSPKITAEVEVKVPLSDSDNTPLNNSSKSDPPAGDAKGSVTALPVTDADSTIPPPSTSEKQSGSESEQNASVSVKPAPDYYARIPYDASLGAYVPRDKKDELILKLVPRMKDLQNELQVWTEWANQKVKQATVRLLKDQPEIKALRKEREEAEQYKKEKQLLEENTRKRLCEMEFALNNASDQLEKANNTVRRFELEQSLLKKEMEAAKIRAAESAESFREAKERGQKTLKNAQSWEGQKVLLQEELKSQRDKVAELQQEVAKANSRQCQIKVRCVCKMSTEVFAFPFIYHLITHCFLHIISPEWKNTDENPMQATWKQEKAAREKLLAQAACIKKEREQVEALGKTEEERIKMKAEHDMKYYMENIKRLESEISKLKLESDCLKIAELKKGIDGIHGSKGGDFATKPNQTESAEKGAKPVWGNLRETKIKRERECVMCLSEEMTVIFLPCAHQVLCSKCNQLHEKQGMEECPSCRATIQRRIQARFSLGRKKADEKRGERERERERVGEVKETPQAGDINERRDEGV